MKCRNYLTRADVLLTLPTRPLVFLTPFLVSKLLLVGLVLDLFTLMSPFPLALLLLVGVFWPDWVSWFSTSLSPPGMLQVEVVIVVVVVQLTALRFWAEPGLREARRASILS